MRMKSKRSGVKADVDLIPMIDVVFQLILFFLVSTTFVVMPGIKLNLPKSSTSESTPVAGITITADKNGGLWFNDKAVNFVKLGKELSLFDTGKRKKEEISITLEADGEVTNATIVNIFDIIRANGYTAVNLRTRKR
jgi:biopolymer transport protein ExbD